MGHKRPRDEMEGKDSQPSSSSSPFMPMFEQFRAELDEHHDRRERIIKASRDITAASKKIIFALQRSRTLNQPIPQHIRKETAKHAPGIGANFAAVAPDLRGINAHRYARQISGGCQEWMEAASFEHYLAHGTLLSHAEAAAKLQTLAHSDPPAAPAAASSAGGEDDGEKALSSVDEERDAGGERAVLGLSHEDYLLGIYDMTGELMRFAITSMATGGALPAVRAPASSIAAANGDDGGEETQAAAMEASGDGAERTVLTDMRGLRAQLESLEVGTGPFAREVEKKMEVMKQSVEKVERALYGLVVRGAERPKGWMPDMNEGGGRPVGVEV